MIEDDDDDDEREAPDVLPAIQAHGVAGLKDPIFLSANNTRVDTHQGTDVTLNCRLARDSDYGTVSFFSPGFFKDFPSWFYLEGRVNFLSQLITQPAGTESKTFTNCANLEIISSTKPFTAGHYCLAGEPPTKIKEK